MKKKKGFTLIELIAVLVIMAIIALIVTPLVLNIIRKVRISADKRSVDAYGRSVEYAIATYLLDNGYFPSDLHNLNIEYSGDEVVCNVMSMKENGEIYLSECKVNNKEIKDSSTDDGYYHYGNMVVEHTAVGDLLSKANAVTITNYNDGNTGEMYTFSHSATEQTGELIDYRYIGKSPNNYVIFNNEVWRIIGVFTVEDKNGNFAQRMKIMRNNYLPNKMAWNSDNSNEWTNATLNTYLNVTYYNSLNEDARKMINDSKYYLGGVVYPDEGAEVFYSWERGVDVVDENSTSWIGKIALIYPSDYLYTYGLGVHSSCYDSAQSCYRGDLGWMYMIHNNNSLDQWLLSPLLASLKSQSIVGSSFKTWGSDEVPVTVEHYIYPALYLSSQVKIKSGDGTEQNPYQISL